MTKMDTTFSFLGSIFTEANAKYPQRILKAINNAKTIRTCCVEAGTRYDTGMTDLANDQLR